MQPTSQLSKKASQATRRPISKSNQRQLLIRKAAAHSHRAPLLFCILFKRPGSRACPPEDCGGNPGYEDLVDAMKTPGHPDREDLIDWLGEEFDPEVLDLKEANKRLSKLKLDKLKRRRLSLPLHSTETTANKLSSVCSASRNTPVSISRPLPPRWWIVACAGSKGIVNSARSPLHRTLAAFASA
ncbi:MAG: hypothetical protein KDN22_07175 [Verrucomicrobiae bacterium]|nr:hypothetical protein [Verrucomicrobiae bacterium]